jgi:precorrin-6B methylase 2
MKTAVQKKMVFLLFLLIGTIPLWAQEKQGDNEFHPYSGQEGKDVVWVPTPQELVETMLNIAKLTPEDFVIDLGSGDGRTVITAAKRGAKARGFEFNPNMVALSRQNASKEGVSERAEFVEGDLFKADLSKATVITMFLLPEINMRLRPTLLGLSPGTRIVSNTFQMEDWIPDSTARANDICEAWCDAYLWIVPAKVSGIWKSSKGTLKLSQEFQRVSGTLDNGKKVLKVSEGKLTGNQISFVINGEKYSGVVNGRSINGICSADKTSWTAALIE